MSIKFYIDGEEVSKYRAVARMRSMVVRPLPATRISNSSRQKMLHHHIASSMGEEIARDLDRSFGVSKVYFMGDKN